VDLTRSLSPHTASHHFRQTFAYCQAKACSPIPACSRRIGLAESLEQVLHAFRLNPMPVSRTAKAIRTMGHPVRYLPMGLRIRLFLYPSGIDTDTISPFSVNFMAFRSGSRILIHTRGSPNIAAGTLESIRQPSSNLCPLLGMKTAQARIPHIPTSKETLQVPSCLLQSSRKSRISLMMVRETHHCCGWSAQNHAAAR